MRRRLLFIMATALLAFSSLPSLAQFKNDAFTQDYSNGQEETESSKDSSSLFSFKEYFGALSHKNTTRIGTLTAGSAVFIGGSQIYNNQKWKLPFIYGGIAAGVGAGYYLGSHDHKTASTLCYGAAGAVWYASLMDGVVNFDKGNDPHPGRATLYSVLCPGLGQVYNGETWKVPIYWSCLLGAGHFYFLNARNYKRFKRIHNEASTTDGSYTEAISASTALYRRYRDYSLVFLGGFYLLQAVDANVFCYMRDFELSEDLSMHIEPAVIAPGCEYAFAGGASRTGYGLSIGFRF